MHLHVSCHFICLVSLVLDIILHTLTFKFLKASGTQILAYGSLILLQLPLHLFTLILNGNYCEILGNIELLLLILIISGLTNKFTHDKLPKNIIAETNICFMNLIIFILFHYFLLNICECL